ncbi:MAG: dipeptidase [Planctomycetota bacterium]|jgi:acetylornithine deacetylase/succinyl-diaminopimelate desuccinylase-like protein
MRVAGLLMAGGASTRFGSDKLEATLGGQRLLDIACGNFLEAGLDPVVYCGHGRPSDPRVQVVAPGAEMIETLRNGLNALPDMPFAFAPADMPLLRPALVRRLREAFLASGRRFLVPVFSGRRGHPAFARDKRPFFESGDEGGPREVWRHAGDELLHFEAHTPDVLADVDTRADLDRVSAMKGALDYLEANRDRFLEQLFEFLRIPSISAQSDSHGDARRAAEWIRQRLEDAGMTAALFDDGGDGLPTVTGELKAGDDKPTILIYGHYDVQPPEPLELWETPPFEPTVIDGEIRARGCADDKGPTLAMVLAAECWTKGAGESPVNLKLVIEGEEESGGQVVYRYLEKHRDDLKADALVIADVSGAARGVPALCYGLRGLAALEVKVTGPARDLHSGTYGGTVMNPATAVARIIASLHDENGHVAVAGFYDGVSEIDATERERFAAVPFDEEAYRAELAVPELFGEAGYSTLERKSARPTCEINGIFGGYDGEGSKTIVPAEAGCKLTCRLVPGQDPNAIADAVEAHLKAHCPPGVRLEVEQGHKAAAVYTDPDTEWSRRARKALEAAFEEQPCLLREGGTIPVAIAFQEVLGLPPLLLGTYTPGERAHSPNERYFVEDFYGGIRTGIHLFGAK